MTMTRNDYMNSPVHLVGAGPAERAALHRAYYAQLVTPATINSVVSFIGADALRKSTDEHLNDIPLSRWDQLTKFLPCKPFKDLGDYATLSGLVCVAKEAARQWIEADQSKAA